MQHKAAGNRSFFERGRRLPVISSFPPQPSHHSNEAVSNNLYNARCEDVAAPANAVFSPESGRKADLSTRQGFNRLYTDDQRRRRDATKWTLVQGILAPLQFLVFLVSLFFVIRYLMTGEGLSIATVSIVVKTLFLYAIMITGSIWEREVFGCYLFAPAFFWEDVFSFLVLALHTAYIAALIFDLGSPREQMLLALAAYATYVINATQFILKLRAARRDESMHPQSAPAIAGSGA